MKLRSLFLGTLALGAASTIGASCSDDNTNDVRDDPPGLDVTETTEFEVSDSAVLEFAEGGAEWELICTQLANMRANYDVENLYDFFIDSFEKGYGPLDAEGRKTFVDMLDRC